jgi:hypothetical protein
MLVVALICVFLSSLYMLKQQRYVMKKMDNIEKLIEYVKRK